MKKNNVQMYVESEEESQGAGRRRKGRIVQTIEFKFRTVEKRKI